MSPPASQETLEALAEANGYDVRVLERVARILGLLQAIFADEMLKDMYVLKGGTALNVFHLDLPRLSVDIDLNFVGALDLDETRGMRGGLEDQIARIARSQGFQVPPPPGGHAGGKWRLRFESVLGGAGQIEVDLNYLHRVPLLPVENRRSHPSLEPLQANGIPTLSLQELAAGKLVALITRQATRDLFDSKELLLGNDLNLITLRTPLVVYGAMSPFDWRLATPAKVGFRAEELRETLLPVLNRKVRTQVEQDPEWANRMMEEVRDRLAPLLSLSPEEEKFVRLVHEEGTVDGSVLGLGKREAELVESLPGLKWRALGGARGGGG